MKKFSPQNSDRIVKFVEKVVAVAVVIERYHLVTIANVILLIIKFLLFL